MLNRKDNPNVIFEDKIIHDADGYKPSHAFQYPPEADAVVSYVEARGHDTNGGPEWENVLTMGRQPFILRYLNWRVNHDDVTEAKEDWSAKGAPFDEDGWRRIVDHHDGFMPVRIEALPEGLVVPLRVPQSQVFSTDPKLKWATSFIETAWLRAEWPTSTVATLSFHISMDIYAGLVKSCDEPDGPVMMFALNDFGARGVSSQESAALLGMGHLASFMGSDNNNAIRYIRKVYGDRDIYGFTVPAAEHSTITAWGRAREAQAYANMIEQFAELRKMPIFAVVSDSYDLYHAVENIWGGELKDRVIQCGSRLVVRPDSGKPSKVVVDTLDMLAKAFGFRVNKKGYKVLPDYVRVIQGDGINQKSIREIIRAVLAAGFSLENVCFGMGGALLQQINRDTLKYAMKCNAIRNTNGEWIDIYKDPATDSGKRSKKGRQAVILENGIYQPIRLEELGTRENFLQPIWDTGKMLNVTSFAEIKARRDEGFKRLFNPNPDWMLAA